MGASAQEQAAVDAKGDINRYYDQGLAGLLSQYNQGRSDISGNEALGRGALGDYYNYGQSQLAGTTGQQVGALGQGAQGALGALSQYYQQGMDPQFAQYAAGQGGTDYLRNLVSNPTELTQAYQYESGLANESLDKRLRAQGLYGSGAALEAGARTNAQIANDIGQRRQSAGQFLSGLGANAANNIQSGYQSLGQGTANIYGQLGAGLSDVYGQYGRGSAGMASDLGQRLAASYSGEGNNLATLAQNYGGRLGDYYRDYGQQLGAAGSRIGAARQAVSPLNIGLGLASTAITSGFNPFAMGLNLAGQAASGGYNSSNSYA